MCVYVRVCTHAYSAYRGQKMSDTMELEALVNSLMWGLGTKLGLSTEVIWALNCLIVSPAPEAMSWWFTPKYIYTEVALHDV